MGLVLAALVKDVALSAESRIIGRAVLIRADNHPKEASLLLRRMGVADEFILDSVLHHHERLDGSGFPNGLTQEKLGWGPRLLAVVDAFLSRLIAAGSDGNSRRRAMLEVLRESDGDRLDKEAVAMLLTLGIFEEGGLVRLTTGEEAVVIAQAAHGDDATAAARPIVRIIRDRNGNRLNPPRYVNLALNREVSILRAA